MDFERQTAVVTGAASGIGRATAEALAQAGAHVFLGDIDAARGEELAQAIVRGGQRAEFLQLDVTCVDSVARFSEEVHKRCEGLDVLVNAAGWDRIEPFLENTPEYWEQIIALNFMGPLRLARAFLPGMVQRQRGKIVNVASDAGRVGSTGETVYAGAKGGIIAFTKSLAREMARYGICVNCISPGPTDTPLFASQPEKMREALVRAIPLRRLAKPSEIADAILFLASARADYITGQVLSVSGGLTMAG